MIYISIKSRITLWFTLLMLIITGLSLGFVAVSGEYLAEGGAKNRIVEVLSENAGELEYEDGELQTDDDFEYYSGGVMTAVCGPDGSVIFGQTPHGLSPRDVPFAGGEVRTVTVNGEPYYLFDITARSVGKSGVWLRGIASASGGGNLVAAAAKSLFVILPFLVLLAAAGGYIIAKNAFKPVDRIISAADAISGGGDLSRRLALPERGDEIHKLAATFDRMFARLEDSFTTEKQFTSDASHELRTPVAVIMGQCEYLETEERTADEYANGISVIKRQAEKMSRLINQLLSLTRLEGGAARAVFEHADLSELAEVVCREFFAARDKTSLRTETGSDIYADVDIALMARLLENLLENSCKYGREGGTTTVSLKKDGSFIKLTVADDGIGISAEDMPKIWQRFYQADSSRGADGGMGLGLSLVKRIAELHGGRVSAESEPGKGSTFTVIIPASARTV